MISAPARLFAGLGASRAPRCHRHRASACPRPGFSQKRSRLHHTSQGSFEGSGREDHDVPLVARSIACRMAGRLGRRRLRGGAVAKPEGTRGFARFEPRRCGANGARDPPDMRFDLWNGFSPWRATTRSSSPNTDHGTVQTRRVNVCSWCRGQRSPDRPGTPRRHAADARLSGSDDENGVIHQVIHDGK